MKACASDMLGVPGIAKLSNHIWAPSFGIA